MLGEFLLFFEGIRKNDKMEEQDLFYKEEFQ
jgi:hypothetical protein